MSWMSWEQIAKHKYAGGLDFRHFLDFNPAMLDKQGWRFMIYPESLVSRLYKAKYFAGNFFLTSTLGHNPNFIWKSIFEAKQLILDEIR